MGKILTYEDIEAEGGTINRRTTNPPGEPGLKFYEGDAHCPASSDWWRITNVACPYSAANKRCTDTTTIALSSPAYFGYAWSNSTSSTTKQSENCTVTFPDGINYQINFPVMSSVQFRVNTTGYNDIIIQWGNQNLNLIAPHNSDGAYSINEISITFDQKTTGTFQAFYGYYYRTVSNQLYIDGFTSIGFAKTVSTPTDTISFRGITIPKMPTNKSYDGIVLVIGNPSELKS